MNTENASDRAAISTKELARLLNTKQQSIYKRLCVTGSYWGIQPTKLPNGRLLWPANAVEQLKKSTCKEEAQSIPPLYGDKVHLTGALFCGGFCTPRTEVKQ